MEEVELELSPRGVTQYLIQCLSEISLDEERPNIVVFNEGEFFLEFQGLRLTIQVRDNSKFN